MGLTLYMNVIYGEIKVLLSEQNQYLYYKSFIISLNLNQFKQRTD